MKSKDKQFNQRNAIDLRLQLQIRFPVFTQRFWTWLTGIALPDQVPLFIWRPWVRALALFAQTIVAASIGTLLLNDLIMRGGLWG